MLSQVGQLDVHTCPESGAQVGWAREDVAQVRVPHELIVLGLEESFDLRVEKGRLIGEAWLETLRTLGNVDCPHPSLAPNPLVSRPWVRTRPDLSEASAESCEHFLHVAPLLHGDDPQVVLFVDPYQESLIVIVPGGGV